jgi:hypothetical protein
MIKLSCYCIFQQIPADGETLQKFPNFPFGKMTFFLLLLLLFSYTYSALRKDNVLTYPDAASDC